MAQYIFFDLDGTLTDSGPGIIHSVLYALERMGRPEPDVEKVRRTFIGPPLTVSFHSLYGYTPQQCQQAIAYFREDYNHKGIYNNRPYDGIPELLHDLKAAGKTLAVATSKPYQLAERVLEHFDLRQYFDLVCGGSMEVLCEALTPEQAGLFALADQVLREGGRGVWTVDVSRESLPQRRLHLATLPEVCPEVWPEGFARLDGSPAVRVDLDAALPLLEELKNKAGLLSLGERAVYVEPLDAPPVLLLCGGGHVSLEVAGLAQACGFVVDVVDDRPEFSDPARFPMARRCLTLPGFENLVEACGIGRRHYVAIVTRGHSFDREALAQALTSHASYIGMIGSKAKREQVYAFLRAQGVPDTELAAVRCPIGLPIGAETPRQIAVSVVAELLAARAGTLQRLRFED